MKLFYLGLINNTFILKLKNEIIKKNGAFSTIFSFVINNIRFFHSCIMWSPTGESGGVCTSG